LQFDGKFVWWTHEGAEDWEVVDGQIFPGHDAVLRNVPPAPEGLVPALITPLREPGMVQIWTGFYVRLAPDWALLSRGPANIPAQGYEHFEGLIEALEWFGPLFTNIRLTHTGAPVRFHSRYPLLQVQALPRASYAEPPFAILGLEDLSASDWHAYAATLARAADDTRKLGAYAIESRRRARRA
jgi:hypothetical protein